MAHKGSHAQDDRDVAHHLAGAGGKGEGNLVQGDSRNNSQRQGRQREAHRGMQPQPPNEEQQQRDGARYAGQQKLVMSGGSDWGHRPIISARQYRLIDGSKYLLDWNLRTLLQIVRWCFNLLERWFV